MVDFAFQWSCIEKVCNQWSYLVKYHRGERVFENIDTVSRRSRINGTPVINEPPVIQRGKSIPKYTFVKNYEMLFILKGFNNI